MTRETVPETLHHAKDMRDFGFFGNMVAICDWFYLERKKDIGAKVEKKLAEFPPKYKRPEDVDASIYYGYVPKVDPNFFYFWAK